MAAWRDVTLGLLRLGAVAAGIFYLAQVLMAYARTKGHFRLVVDRNNRLDSARQILLWAGVGLVSVTVRLARPLVNMLSDASAEVGEWAWTRHQSHVAARPHSH